jgi:AcrR family transcriptional regulator
VSRREEIVDAAQGLLEREGPEALTMRRVAAVLGIKAPSLYKQITGKAELEAALQARALQQQATAFAEASDLSEMAAAYRRWALDHPQLYQLLTRRPLDRTRVAAELEAAAAAPLLSVCHNDIDRARALWGVAHGLVDLELARRFPADADIDRVWSVAIAAFSAGAADHG